MKRWVLPLVLLCAGLAAAWPLRRYLTAEAIAARSPGQTGLAAAFLLALYAAKSLSVAFPLSALTAAGGLLFPLPVALAVNLTGTAIVQLLPFLLGRRQRADFSALRQRYPRLGALANMTQHPRRTVFLLRLGGATPGDLVSMFLGAADVPLGSYLTGGLLGAAPRVLCATLLGAALWEIGGRRFWLSVGTGALLTVTAVILWRFLSAREQQA